MSEDQKKLFKDHHKARTILLNALSYNEYEKITNKETAKSIFDSLQMTHEGNSQVKETKALALIQKYETFRMEEEESVETMFSRFQMLVAGLRVLDKGYSTSDHVKKIIRSLPAKWRPMVTALKVAKDLNSISLEELISSLRSHEIELQEDEPRRKVKTVALKSSTRKAKALQAKEESEDSEEGSEEDELSLISRRINRLWKHRQGRSFNKGPRNAKGRFESTSGQKMFADREVICFECNEPGHYKNDCPKLRKEEKFKRVQKGRKGLMATWDDSESEEGDSDEERAAVALMASAGARSEVLVTSEADSDSDSDVEDEVLSPFSPHELKACLLEIMEKYNSLRSKYKILKKDFMATSQASEKYKQSLVQRDEQIASLKNSNVYLINKITKLEKEFSSDGSNNEKKYEKSFQYFLAKSIDRSKMASLIYGVSNRNNKGLGYSETYENHKNLNEKPKALYEQFVPSGTHVRSSEPTHSEGSRRQPQKRNKSLKTKAHAQIPLKYSTAKPPKVLRTSGKKKTIKKGPRRWVPKNKIVYLADLLDGTKEK